MQLSTTLSLAILGLATLLGCAEQREAEATRLRAEASARQRQRAIICDKEFPPRMGNYVSRAACLGAALSQYNMDLGGESQDLVEVYRATMMVLASKADRGEITYDQEKLELAKLWSEEVSETQHRRASASAAESARISAVLPALQMQQMQPQVQHPQPVYIVPCTLNQQIARTC